MYELSFTNHAKQHNWESSFILFQNKKDHKKHVNILLQKPRTRLNVNKLKDLHMTELVNSSPYSQV